MKKALLWAVLGCLIFAVGFLAGSFWSTMKFFRSLPNMSSRVEPVEDFSGSRNMDNDFYGYLFWGGTFKRMNEMEPLPKGDAQLKVRFSYNQKPAAGVGFILALNGKYATNRMTTDADGEAVIPLPFGQWNLNRMACRTWNAKPNGDFLLVSGDEAKLGDASLGDLFFTSMGDGRTLYLSKDGDPVQTVEIQIRDRMKILWPSPAVNKQHATIADSTIQWEPYPRAASYVVQINRVTHESARSTTYSPIFHKRVDGASSLALAQFPNAASDLPSREYAVEIRAYDKNGSFLSETDHSFSTFVLTDNRTLVEYDQSQGMLFDQGDVDRRFQAQKIMEAAVLLIEKEMFPEARKLLEQADASAMPGQAALINGYLNAAQGQCEQAERHFTEAAALGETCIPESYRAGCAME